MAWHVIAALYIRKIADCKKRRLRWAAFDIVVSLCWITPRWVSCHGQQVALASPWLHLITIPHCQLHVKTMAGFVEMVVLFAFMCWFLYPRYVSLKTRDGCCSLQGKKWQTRFQLFFNSFGWNLVLVYVNNSEVQVKYSGNSSGFLLIRNICVNS